MKEQSLPELIKSATEMLHDIKEEEAELIYWCCKLDDDERTAIILAYQNIRRGEEE